MKKLRKRLGAIASALGLTNASLAIARARVEHLRKASQHNHRQAQNAAGAADRLRAHGHKEKAAKQDRRHSRFLAKYLKLDGKRADQVGKVKRIIQKRDGLLQRQEELETEVAKHTAKGVVVKGNQVTGGTAENRLRAGQDASAAACAGGRRLNRYSQAGYKDLEHCIERIKYGARDDCSSWLTSLAKACGLPDPNGYGYDGPDWTGSLEAYLRGHGLEVSESYARQHPCIELFGPVGATHHDEVTCGNGTDQTTGHGSAPVDRGSFHMLGGEVRFYKFPTKETR